MSVLICVSATEEDVARLTDDGPRRDFLELAALTGGRLRLSPRGGGRGGWLRRLLGPHVSQAWSAAGDAADGDVVFADGEHVGIPLAVFLRLRSRRARVVMLGHFVSKPWKAALLRLATRIGVRGRLLVHSQLQARAAEKAAGRRWSVSLVPYQVDTDYWHARGESLGGTILAVGAEGRDYATLQKAAAGTGLPVRIAAGSHWARAARAPIGESDNLAWFREPLSFASLREEYEAARLVVVPLQDVENQSGVTTVLEAMSMSRPVIVTATRGQLEVVTGPLVQADGRAVDAVPSRGAHIFGAGAESPGIEPRQSQESLESADGIYVPVADAAALRQAITLLVEDTELALKIARAGRATVERCFTVESYAERLSREINLEAHNLGAHGTRVAAAR